MRATEELPARFVAVAKDAAATMSAFRRQRMNGAFERIEIMRNAVLHDFQWLVVFIAAHFAGRASVTILIPQRHFVRVSVVPKFR